MLHPNGLLFLALPTSENWNAFTEGPVAPSPAAFRPPLFHFFILKCLYLPIRVTLTHFALSSYDRAVRLPTSFPILCLARLWIKPRLSRSSWRAFVSTHPLVLSSREVLFSCCPSPWNLPFFTVESTVSSPCFRSDPPFFSKVGCRLFWLSPPLQSGQIALFLLSRAALLLILQALHWSRQHQQVCLFSDSRSVLVTCSLLHLSFYLKLSGRNCLLFPAVLLRYNRLPDTRFFWGTARLMSWPYRERYLCYLQFLVVSLWSLVFTLLFSRTGGILSHLNSLTHRFPRFPPRNLCSFVMLVFSLVYAGTDTAYG